MNSASIYLVEYGIILWQWLRTYTVLTYELRGITIPQDLLGFFQDWPRTKDINIKHQTSNLLTVVVVNQHAATK